MESDSTQDGSASEADKQPVPQNKTVEKISEMRYYRGVKQYLVHWAGTESTEDTWEIIPKLKDGLEKIKEFEAERKKAKKEQKKQEKADQSKRKKHSWYYVSSSEDEQEGVKDRFWKDLDDGKLDLFRNPDLYSTVKTAASRTRRPSLSDGKPPKQGPEASKDEMHGRPEIECEIAEDYLAETKRVTRSRVRPTKSAGEAELKASIESTDLSKSLMEPKNDSKEFSSVKKSAKKKKKTEKKNKTKKAETSVVLDDKSDMSFEVEDHDKLSLSGNESKLDGVDAVLDEVARADNLPNEEDAETIEKSSEDGIDSSKKILADKAASNKPEKVVVPPEIASQHLDEAIESVLVQSREWWDLYLKNESNKKLRNKLNLGSTKELYMDEGSDSEPAPANTKDTNDTPKPPKKKKAKILKDDDQSNENNSAKKSKKTKKKVDMIEDVLNKEETVVTPEIVKKKKKASVPDIKENNEALERSLDDVSIISMSDEDASPPKLSKMEVDVGDQVEANKDNEEMLVNEENKLKEEIKKKDITVEKEEETAIPEPVVKKPKKERAGSKDADQTSETDISNQTLETNISNQTSETKIQTDTAIKEPESKEKMKAKEKVEVVPEPIFDLATIDPPAWNKEYFGPKYDWKVMKNDDLLQAVKNNDYWKVKSMVEHPEKFDLEQPDERTNMSLLMTASRHAYNDIIALLVMNGADIDRKLKDGTTALTLACERGHFSTVAYLCYLGAKINKALANGDTPLVKAVKNGHKHVVKVLLDHAVNISASTSSTDRTALNLAKQFNFPIISELLQSHKIRLTTELVRQASLCLEGSAKIGQSLFPIQCLRLMDDQNFKIDFRHELQSTKANRGMLLFIGHGHVASQEVQCSLRGTSVINKAVLNDVTLQSLTEDGQFILTFSPLHDGHNQLTIETVPVTCSNYQVHLIVCAYVINLA